MNSKALATSARRLEAVQKLLSDLESFKRKVTDCFTDGLIDQAACQQARMGTYHAETGLRAFALTEEKAFERAGGDFFRRKVSPSGMLHGR